MIKQVHPLHLTGLVYRYDGSDLACAKLLGNTQFVELLKPHAKTIGSRSGWIFATVRCSVRSTVNTTAVRGTAGRTGQSGPMAIVDVLEWQSTAT